MNLLLFFGLLSAAQALQPKGIPTFQKKVYNCTWLEERSIWFVGSLPESNGKVTIQLKSQRGPYTILKLEADAGEREKSVTIRTQNNTTGASFQRNVYNYTAKETVDMTIQYENERIYAAIDGRLLLRAERDQNPLVDRLEIEYNVYNEKIKPPPSCRESVVEYMKKKVYNCNWKDLQSMQFQGRYPDWFGKVTIQLKSQRGAYTVYKFEADARKREKNIILRTPNNPRRVLFSRWAYNYTRSKTFDITIQLVGDKIVSAMDKNWVAHVYNVGNPPIDRLEIEYHAHNQKIRIPPGCIDTPREYSKKKVYNCIWKDSQSMQFQGRYPYFNGKVTIQLKSQRGRYTIYKFEADAGRYEKVITLRTPNDPSRHFERYDYNYNPIRTVDITIQLVGDKILSAMDNDWVVDVPNVGNPPIERLEVEYNVRDEFIRTPPGCKEIP